MVRDVQTEFVLITSSADTNVGRQRMHRVSGGTKHVQ